MYKGIGILVWIFQSGI
uniref:Uncharacterized protein n=1 Tax=Anguilla anguilla TaxID=7936 RepID=A0A0E9S1T6_ANGAN